MIRAIQENTLAPLKQNRLGDRTDIVRDYVIGLMESDRLKAGERLPPARRLAAETGVSFVSVVNAIKTLVNDGVLDMERNRTARVNPEWRQRVLPGTFKGIFQDDGAKERRLFALFQEAVGKHRLHSYKGFENGQFEIRTNPVARMRHRDYADLTPFVCEAIKDESQFFIKVFDACRMGGMFFGVPMSFTPKVVFFNPRLLERAGAAQPRPGWTWEEFVALLRRLRQALPGMPLLNWRHEGINVWMSFIVRAGGALIVGSRPEDVQIDSPQTRLGLRLCKDVADIAALPSGAGEIGSEDDAFLAGRCPLLIGSRMVSARCLETGFDDWMTAPLPLIPGGGDAVIQGTIILCVRKSCHNLDLARRMVLAALSEPLQDFLAEHRLNIPVRRSSAGKSMDMSQPRDTLFLHEASKLKYDYGLNDPQLYDLITSGLSLIWREGADIDALTRQLADTARTILYVRQRDAALRQE